MAGEACRGASSALARRSATSMFPGCRSQLPPRPPPSPPSGAEAGLVPWAEASGSGRPFGAALASRTGDRRGSPAGRHIPPELPELAGSETAGVAGDLGQGSASSSAKSCSDSPAACVWPARTDAAELKTRPGDRHHLGGGVQLHGAGAERESSRRSSARSLGRSSLLDVAQHFGFAMSGGRSGWVKRKFPWRCAEGGIRRLALHSPGFGRREVGIHRRRASSA